VVICAAALAGGAEGATPPQHHGAEEAVVRTRRAVVGTDAAAREVRTSRPRRLNPVVEGRWSPTAHRQLLEGFKAAVRRAQDVDSCREMFAELGADGIEMLATTVYSTPQDDFEAHLCESATAFTIVGHWETRVCFGFSGLSPEGTAITLIHEALHHAGLGEAPGFDGAPTPEEIDRMVEDRCGF